MTAPIDIIDIIDLDQPRPARGDAPPRLSRRLALSAAVAAVAAVALVRWPEEGRTASVVPALTATPYVHGSFAGVLPGTDVFLLIAVDTAGDVIAYACDSGTTAAWFSGRTTGSTIALTSGTANILSAAAPGRITGTLRLGDARRAFALTPVGRRGGLYAARTAAHGIDHTAGWILLDNGSQRGTVLTGTTLVRRAPWLTSTRGELTTDEGVVLRPARLDRLTPKRGRLPAITRPYANGVP